jgi:predicted nucleic acid-binding protein
MIFLDTCAVIDLLKNNTNVVNLLNSLDGDIAIAPITVFELCVGSYASENKKDLANLKLFLQTININHDSEYELAALIYAKLRKKGLEIPKNDCLIAASVLSIPGSILVTQDTNHFRRIPQLKIKTY